MKRGLLLIDIQNAFLNPWWGERNNPRAEQNAIKLLKNWRNKGWPVLHVQHTSENPESLFYKNGPGHSFKEGFTPIDGEPVFQKSVNSAFIGTNLKEYLDARGIQSLVIVGLTTPHCVSTSTRMAGNYGYDVYLVEDATAAFELKGPNGIRFDPQTIHDTEMAILNGEFAKVTTTKDILNTL